jgi:Uncharacterized protein conserved in bacteria
MPQYAAGGNMDSIGNKKRNNRSNIIGIIEIVIVVILLVFLFGGSLSSKPITVTNQTAVPDSIAKEYHISFTMNNKTLGLLFNPYYIIYEKDESGKTVYTDKVKVGNIMKPLESIDMQVVIPAVVEKGANCTIECHCNALGFIR